MTPYYQQGGITIYHGDCLDILPSLSAGAAEWLMTDPPFNVGKNYGSHDDRMNRDTYVDWCRQWFAECQRITAAQIVFPGHGNLPVWWSVSCPVYTGCYYKPGSMGGFGLVPFCEWEPWLLWGSKRLKGSDVIRVPVASNLGKDTGGHPCPKPVPLFTALLLRTQAATVLDPFAGTGTTLVAAYRLGLPAIGIELDERHCATCVRRLRQQVLPLDPQQEPVRVSLDFGGQP